MAYKTDKKQYGCMYITSSAETSIAIVSTPIKVAGTTTEIRSSDKVTVSSSNRITYTGVETKVFEVSVSLSMIAAGNNKIASLYVAKNGTVVAATNQRRAISTGADIGSISLGCMPEMATDDYIELWIENTTDNTNMTVTLMSMVLVEV